MLGQQFDGMTIRDGVRLRKVPHCFDQQALTIHITGIGSTLTSFLSAYIWGDRDSEDLGHFSPT